MKTPLKWVGGKSRLVPTLRELFPSDVTERVYVEPFAGSAALFFDLEPHTAVLSDTNVHLINTLVHLQKDPEGVLRCLQGLVKARAVLPDPNDHYRSVRAAFNTCPSRVLRAAQFIYLNKTCFNGIWRVNRRGRFNVPPGRYKNPPILDEARLRDAHRVLERAAISAKDFRVSVPAYAGPRAFIYFDPPYIPVSPTANFTSYTCAGFSDMDHVHLFRAFRSADVAGAKLMLSNSDTPRTRELYAGYDITEVQVGRSVNSNTAKRGKVTELVIRNYS